MLTEALLVLAVSADVACRVEAQSLRHDYRPPDRTAEYRLSRAEDQCWSDPERGLQELRGLRGDLRVDTQRPRPSPTWRVDEPPLWNQGQGRAGSPLSHSDTARR